MGKFRKKPVVIDAMQLTPECDLDQLCEFMGGEAKRNIDFSINYVNRFVVIQTLEGSMTARLGDWIIKGLAGEYYPCKPDIFEKTYEAVPPAAPVTDDSNGLDAARKA
jgi:hypothetical protein